MIYQKIILIVNFLLSILLLIFIITNNDINSMCINDDRITQLDTVKIYSQVYTTIKDLQQSIDIDKNIYWESMNLPDYFVELMEEKSDPKIILVYGYGGANNSIGVTRFEIIEKKIAIVELYNYKNHLIIMQFQNQKKWNLVYCIEKEISFHPIDKPNIFLKFKNE